MSNTFILWAIVYVLVTTGIFYEVFNGHDHRSICDKIECR
jgi:hypothetical protein